MRVVILGGGESGLGAAILAKRMKLDVFLSDKGRISEERRKELEDYKVDFEEGQHTFEKLVSADIVIKSPGIPGDSHVVSRLKEEGVQIISELEWAFRHTDSKILAITGSNGKTTTTKLCHHLASQCGLDVVAVGNIGHSISRWVADHRTEWLVVEVSSFQLDDIVDFRPEIGVILNITPDHLDRYDGFRDYALAKWRIAENQLSSDHLIFIESPILRELQLEDPVSAKIISIPETDCLAGKVRFRGEWLAFDNSHLRGPHNAQNVACAMNAVALMGADVGKLKAEIESFVNDPHRTEMVADWRGIKVINDSKATNVDSTQKALMSFEHPIVWIAGGTDKGNDYSGLIPLVEEKVQSLVAMGADNEKIIKAFSDVLEDIADTGNVEDAVREAFDRADQGTTILFSPACASFDLFSNYIERGDIFKKKVLEHINRIG